MKIDGWDISNARAKQWRFTMGNHKMKTDSEWIESAVVPVFLTETIDFKECSLDLMVYGDSYQEVVENQGKILSRLRNKVTLKFDNSTNYFDCILTSSDVDEKNKGKWHILNLKFSGFEYREQKSIHVVQGESTSFTVENTGSMETPIVLTIIPTETTDLEEQTSETVYQLTDYDGAEIIDADEIPIVGADVWFNELTVDGICKDPITGERTALKIENIHLGATIIIDGETGLVTQDGISKIEDVTMWSLPTIEPGENIITTNGNFMDITVSYKSRVF